MRLFVFLLSFWFAHPVFAQYEGEYLGGYLGVVTAKGDFTDVFKTGFETGLTYRNQHTRSTWNMRVGYIRLEPTAAYEQTDTSAYYLEPFRGLTFRFGMDFHLFNDNGYRKLYPTLGLDMAYQLTRLEGVLPGGAFEEIGRLTGAPVLGMNYHINDNLALRAHAEWSFSFGTDITVGTGEAKLESTLLPGYFATLAYRL
jgi:hypothetical protein